MNKVLLIILDGFGEGKDYKGNAVSRSNTPVISALKKKYPHTLLKASGNAVGVPEGTQGGSEVGHFTIGAGRRVFQTLEEINQSILSGDFYKKPALIEACRRVDADDKAALHLIGMISDQGVHSHINHLFALLELAAREKVKKVYVHAITDGRDAHERSAKKYIAQIQEKNAAIATIIGRYYAMDRDSNWEKRISIAYDLYTNGNGVKEADPVAAIENAYFNGAKTDYYIKPILLDKNGLIKNNDSVIFWNFRSDRARELTWAFTGEPDSRTGKPISFKPKIIVRPHFVCMGPYSALAPVCFPTPIVKNNLGTVIAERGLRQLRIGETQKYAHVTYFLNNQIEAPLKNEDRLMIDSPKCASYAEKPEMSALEITDALLPKLKSQKYDFIALNFANCDLVGHSGVFKAAVKAVETIDGCVDRILPAARENGYDIIITGDHGNAEYMIYEDSGEPCPSHTMNPVPFILISEKFHELNLPAERDPELQDAAPTVLALLKVPQPKEMTGSALVLQSQAQ